jgi:hypothetical protein
MVLLNVWVAAKFVPGTVKPASVGNCNAVTLDIFSYLIAREFSGLSK